MGLRKLDRGERTFGASAILLFGLLFFHWFAVDLTNGDSDLLVFVRAWVPDKSGWEALGSSGVVLLLTVTVALAAVWLRLAIPRRPPHAGLDAAVAVLGVVSAGLILFRIVDAPTFYPHSTLVSESTAQPPMFLALGAAAGIALGGLLASFARNE